jgi:hypothetical protein
MPYYGARRINVRIVAASLNDCSTRDPQISNDYEPTDEAARCQKALEDGILLAETPISDAATALPGFLHIIGPDHSPVPLYISHTSTKLPSQIFQAQSNGILTRNTEEQNVHSTLQTSIDAASQPYAIAILIELSRHAVQHLSSDDSWPPPDVRYDIFLNADLVASNWLEGSKFHYQLPEEKNLLLEPDRILITGKRIHKYLERPMVVLPHGINSRGELYASTRRRIGTKDKWTAVGKGLEKWVDDMKYGLNDRESQSPLAIYLESLAALPITAEIEGLDSKGPQSFAIIDVVISKGKGRLAKPPLHSTDAKLLQPVTQQSQELDTASKTIVSTLDTQQDSLLITRRSTEIPSVIPSPISKASYLKQNSFISPAKKRGRRARQPHQPTKPSKLREILPRPKTPELSTHSQTSASASTARTPHFKPVSSIGLEPSISNPTSIHLSKRKVGLIDVAEDTIEALDTELTEPVLCKDSFVTYAEKGTWQTQMSMAGHLRQVKGVKMAEFDVDEVVFATRYIICP